MLSLQDLQNGKKWVGQTAETIRESVKNAGGWSRVFPMHLSVKTEYPEVKIGPFTQQLPLPVPKIEMTNQFPLWASRIRNYFNEEPRSLRLLSADEGQFRVLTIKDRIPPFVPGPHSFALNGDVYVDDQQRYWFAMSTGGTVYHYPGCVNAAKIATATASPQSLIPIFKLISPDDTGGSLELIVHNKKDVRVPLPYGQSFMIGRSTIGPAGFVRNIDSLVERDSIFRGSYNFSETVVAGYLDHDFRDIKPHVEHPDFYVNPDYSKPASKRVFPNIDLSWNKKAAPHC